jgi:CubicO group peptidase (beta-lactamase class C family)
MGRARVPTQIRFESWACMVNDRLFPRTADLGTRPSWVASEVAKPPPPGSIGELKWDSGSGTYFGVDPKLDMVYILMEQTQLERSRITPAFKALVYDAFGK